VTLYNTTLLNYDVEKTDLIEHKKKTIFAEVTKNDTANEKNYVLS